VPRPRHHDVGSQRPTMLVALDPGTGSRDHVVHGKPGCQCMYAPARSCDAGARADGDTAGHLIRFSGSTFRRLRQP
jgi:hypothetical protein